MVWSLAKRAARRLRGQQTRTPSKAVTPDSLRAFFARDWPVEPLQLTRTLAADLPRWVKGAWTVRDGAYLDQLFTHLPPLLDDLDGPTWQAEAPAWLRLACHHIKNGDRNDFLDFLGRGGLDVKRHGGSLEQGHPVVHLPGWESDEIPRDVFVLSENETGFVARIRRARWLGDDLELVITAGLRHLEAPGEMAQAEASWLGHELDVTLAKERFGHRTAAWNETLDACHWVVRVPESVLREAAAEGGYVHMRISLAGRDAAGDVRDIDEDSSAALLTPRAIKGRWWGLDESGRIAVGQGADRRTGPLLASWSITDDAIVVEGTGTAALAELVSPRGRIPAVSVTGDEHRFTARFPVTYDPWGFGPTALPVSDYVLEVDGSPLAAHPELVAQTPKDLHAGALSGYTIVRDGTVGLRLVKPRRPEENTMYGQRKMRRRYQELDLDIDPKVALFQCFWAEVATDSQVPMFHEMRRRIPGLKAYWGVLDHSVAVPEGAIPVVAGSWEWYEILAQAGWIVKNTEVGEYTVLRPGQCYVQTFHGQPFKAMGAGFWRDVKHWPEYRVRWEATTRRSDFWSFIVTPDESADRWYRENYFYQGQILSTGLPRTDPLLAPDAQERRLAVRATLGITPDQIAVLHATTWREDRSGGNNTAADLDFLDVGALAEQLGDSHVILQRSHHSVARSQQARLAAAGVLNVTDYPEINDLILASDVAIVDYSSLRFELALAQVPMVFFVPDLDEYEGQLRGFLFDFEESAPGPLLRDSRQIADFVRNPHTLRQEFGGAIEAFNQRFNAQHDGRAAARVVDALLAWERP